MKADEFNLAFHGPVFDPLKRKMFFHPLRWHANPINSRWRPVERRSRRILRFCLGDGTRPESLLTRYLSLARYLDRFYLRIHQLLRWLRIDGVTPRYSIQAGARYFIQAGERQMRKGRFDRALRYYAIVLKSYPNDVATWSRSCNARMALRDFEGAISDNNTGLSLAPNEIGLIVQHARISHAIGDFEGAMRDLNKALSLAPNNLNLVEEHAEAAKCLEMWDIAIADYDLLLAREPQRPGLSARYASVYGNWGDSLAKVGLPEQALERYAIGLQKCPNDVGILSRRINLKMMLQDYAGAMADANTAVEQAPNEIGLIVQRARVAQAMKQWALALSDYEHAISATTDPDVQRDLRANRELVANSAA